MFEEHYEALPSRMTTRKPLKSVKYSPYTDGDKDTNGLIKKVTSRIGVMFKDFRTAVGSIFKGNEEDELAMQNQPLEKQRYIDRRMAYPSFQNHPITEVDFTNLTQVLSFQNQIRKEETRGFQNLNENQMEISFGGQNQNWNNGSGETTFSFQPHNTSKSKPFISLLLLIIFSEPKYFGKFNIIWKRKPRKQWNWQI